MAPLHSADHNDKNEVKHNVISHVMPLIPALLLCDINCIIKGTILFIWSCNAVGTTTSIT